MRATPRSRSASGGFTLVEVMITLSILAVGLLGLLVLQIYALNDGSRGRHSTAAAMIARDQIELVQRIAYSDAALSATAWTTPPWLDNGGVPGLNPGEVPVRVTHPGGTAMENVYTVWYQVIDDPGGNTDMRMVDLEVVWNEPDITNNRPTRTGQPTVAVSTIIVNNDR